MDYLAGPSFPAGRTPPGEGAFLVASSADMGGFLPCCHPKNSDHCISAVVSSQLASARENVSSLSTDFKPRLCGFIKTLVY